MNHIGAVQRVLEHRRDVHLAYLFGSVSRGEARRSSDVDLGVVFSMIPAPAELDQLATDLEVAAGCRVDLVVLNDAAPLPTHEAIRAGRVIVCRDDDERVGFETRATARYLDTAHLRRVQHHYLRERAEAPVPIRPDVVRRKLLDIGETVGHLRSLLPITIERLERDVTLRWAVEHGLHLAAESLFDAGNRVLSAEFQEVPDEYREIPPRLVARGVIAPATAARLESLAGFRNVLVHDYATVDVRRVHAGLARLDDFEAFVADVELWLARANR